MLNIKNLAIIFFIIFFNFSALSSESDKVTTSSSDFDTYKFEDEIFDPIEPINRAIFSFNNFADRLILEPTAKGF